MTLSNTSLSKINDVSFSCRSVSIELGFLFTNKGCLSINKTVRYCFKLGIQIIHSLSSISFLVVDSLFKVDSAPFKLGIKIVLCLLKELLKLSCLFIIVIYVACQLFLDLSIAMSVWESEEIESVITSKSISLSIIRTWSESESKVSKVMSTSIS